jgi:GNAT superfamily N-acetyltransferase
MENIQIKLIPDSDITSIIPLLKLLNENTDESLLKNRLKEMVDNSYHCVGVYYESQLIGVCGFWLLIKHYVGKHIEPDNVIILPEYRGKGIAEKMMAWIYDYGRENGCGASELNCYVGNSSGVRFWINQGYKIIGYHFQKKL